MRALQALNQSLTDIELEALGYELNLADGHAYQDPFGPLDTILMRLPALWHECESYPVPVWERRFRNAYADLASSPTLASLSHFKVCPTASNSIDIAVAALAQMRLLVRLIEPTFDNLAQLMHRRGLSPEPIDDRALASAAERADMEALVDRNPCGALFVVSPNNPTGLSLDKEALQSLAQVCSTRRIILVLDNSFRFFNRLPYDDYAILKDSGVSFLAIEDTGKVWPTHDLKASLLCYSPDLESIITTIYNELYLCSSRFGLAVLEAFVRATIEHGLASCIWSLVDERRTQLRSAIDPTGLVVDASSIDSALSVEWLDCQQTGCTDLVVAGRLAEAGVIVLPGRQFFWNSSDDVRRHSNLRMNLLRPSTAFSSALAVVRKLDLTRE